MTRKPNKTTISACKLIAQRFYEKLVASALDIETAMDNVQGTNEGDVGTVEIGAKARIIGTNGQPGYDVALSGGFMTSKCTFKSEKEHVGGPDDGVGDDHPLGLTVDPTEPEK